jgi:hypothetical protein
VRSDQPLSSVEAFALALVEASSRLTADPGTRPAAERDPSEPDAPLRDTIGTD